MALAEKIKKFLSEKIRINAEKTKRFQNENKNKISSMEMLILSSLKHENLQNEKKIACCIVSEKKKKKEKS